jgi:hypothetical protein
MIQIPLFKLLHIKICVKDLFRGILNLTFRHGGYLRRRKFRPVPAHEQLAGQGSLRFTKRCTYTTKWANREARSYRLTCPLFDRVGDYRSHWRQGQFYFRVCLAYKMARVSELIGLCSKPQSGSGCSPSNHTRREPDRRGFQEKGANSNFTANESALLVWMTSPSRQVSSTCSTCTHSLVT